MEYGTEEGQVCGREGCDGTMQYPRVKECYCHISPPCSACMDNEVLCTACGCAADENPEPQVAKSFLPDWMR